MRADVLIIGAGRAGAAAACVLAARHCVVLVDRDVVPRFGVGESLIGAARPLLRDLGVVERFEAAGEQPSLGQASAWDSDDIVRRDSFLDPHGPGWRIERVRFETMLRDVAAERGATVIAPGNVLGLAREDGVEQGWTALVRSTSGTHRLRARVVIDPSGRVASFARTTAPSRVLAN